MMWTVPTPNTTKEYFTPMLFGLIGLLNFWYPFQYMTVSFSLRHSLRSTTRVTDPVCPASILEQQKNAQIRIQPGRKGGSGSDPQKTIRIQMQPNENFPKMSQKMNSPNLFLPYFNKTTKFLEIFVYRGIHNLKVF